MDIDGDIEEEQMEDKAVKLNVIGERDEGKYKCFLYTIAKRLLSRKICLSAACLLPFHEGALLA